MTRQRLPNRRPSETCTVEIDGQKYSVTIGFANAEDRFTPREVFIRYSKEGSTLSRILDDASIVISRALQQGIMPADLAKSVSRVPARPVKPADLARPEGGRQTAPASVIGAALDLLIQPDDAA